MVLSGWGTPGWPTPVPFPGGLSAPGGCSEFVQGITEGISSFDVQMLKCTYAWKTSGFLLTSQALLPHPPEVGGGSPVGVTVAQGPI